MRMLALQSLPPSGRLFGLRRINFGPCDVGNVPRLVCAATSYWGYQYAYWNHVGSAAVPALAGPGPVTGGE